MNLNVEKIELGRVNNANFNRVKNFAQSRVDTLKNFLHELENTSSYEFSSVCSNSDYKDIEPICKNSAVLLKEFTLMNETRVAKVKQELENVEKENYEMEEILNRGEQDNKELSVQKKENAEKYKSSIAKIEIICNSIKSSCQELSKIRCDEQTQIHFDKVWIWFLDVIYNTSDIKYQWENFAKSALWGPDKGIDFTNRLNGVDFAKTSAYQIESAKKVFTFSELLGKTLNSSHLGFIFDYIGQFIVAAEARTDYKHAKNTIEKNIKLLSEAKAKQELIHDKIRILGSFNSDCGIMSSTYKPLLQKMLPEEIHVETHAEGNIPEIHDEVVSKPPRNLKLAHQLEETKPEGDEKREGGCGDDCTLI